MPRKLPRITIVENDLDSVARQLSGARIRINELERVTTDHTSQVRWITWSVVTIILFMIVWCVVTGCA